MANNNRHFTPFNIEGCTDSQIFQSINGYEPKKVGFMGKFFNNKDGFTLIDDEAAKCSKTVDQQLGNNDYFMNVFWLAVNEAIKKRVNLV